jgi:hypothetical protein
MTEQSLDPAHRRLDRAIILTLLDVENEQGCPRARLAAEFDDEAQAFEQALERLSSMGVVCIDGEQISASRAVRYMDEIGLISI